MNIAINPVTVGDVVCTRASVSVAVSTGASMSLVPVAPDGTAFPDFAIPVLVASVDPDPAGEEFLDAVLAAAQGLARARGI